MEERNKIINEINYKIEQIDDTSLTSVHLLINKILETNLDSKEGKQLIAKIDNIINPKLKLEPKPFSFPEIEDKKWISHDLKETAIHEIGHLLLIKKLNLEARKISVKPSTRVLGFVRWRLDKEKYSLEEQAKINILVSIAGHVAQSLFNDELLEIGFAKDAASDHDYKKAIINAKRLFKIDKTYNSIEQIIDIFFDEVKQFLETKKLEIQILSKMIIDYVTLKNDKEINWWTNVIKIIDESKIIIKTN